MCDTAKLAATIDFQCDNFLSERGHFLTAGSRRCGASITYEDPSGTVYRPHRCVLSFTIGSKHRDLPILKPALDDLVFVGDRLANADIYFRAIGIDSHVTMARSMMLGPALQESALDAEDKCLICEIDKRLLTEDVFA